MVRRRWWPPSEACSLLPCMLMPEIITTTNPTTGKAFAEHPLMSDEQVRTAIARCHEAFLQWRHERPQRRAEIISAIGTKLEENRAELSELMTREMGKLLRHSRQEVGLCKAICDYTAEFGPSALATDKREIQTGRQGYVFHRPLGVIYGIQPWNFPAYQVVRYSIATLMAGNGVLLKHAPIVTGSGKLLEQIYRDAGLPEHLFTAIVIDHDQSDRVIENELVRGVTFTGSPDAGRHVGSVAAKNLKKTVLELGSNDAYIVLADADLEKAVEHCVKGRVYNNGETCIAAKRFVVVSSVYDRFRDAYVEKMKTLRTGDPTLDETDLGPIARKDLREDLHLQVEQSVAKGAKRLCGGTVPNGEGFFYPATVLEDVAPGQPAYDDELFGPVASLIVADDRDDAMRIANDSRYGLGGGIFTRDPDAAIELAAEHFDTGMVFINGFGLATPSMPFGGVKDSGYGREHGGFGMKEFTNTKAVLVMGG